jgi:aminocarboxymuconate-semialdehyde decarboxylase
VVIHPNGFTEAKRLTRFYFNNVIGNPLETTIALHYLIFDGVLERHPQLEDPGGARRGYRRPIPGGSTTPGARARIHGELPQPPTSYLRKIYFDTVVFTPHQSPSSWRLYGADRIIMGTDYPSTWRLRPDRPRLVGRRLRSLDRGRHHGGNARRLLGVG